MKRYLFLTLLTFSVGMQITAKVTLPAFLGDHMVLQQQSEAMIRGKARPGSKLTVRGSWRHAALSTRVAPDSSWSVMLPTPSAGGPYTLEISDGEPLVLRDILIGEVWFCSGQSNMEMPVKGFRGQPVQDAQQTILAARKERPIRLFTVKRAASPYPAQDVSGAWKLHTPEEVAPFSATAYFFADLLQRVLDVPVGLVHSSWSGSKIEAWMDPDTLRRFREVDLSVLNDSVFKSPNVTPSLLYQAMVKPLQGMKVKGVIWYQGESNSTDPELYARLFPAWVDQNRAFFGNDSLPIYFTEIAPYRSSDPAGINLALFRESQLKSMEQIPHTGMAFTQDAGSKQFIHPPYKKRVGERLAYWALARTYGMGGFSYCGPVARTTTLSEGRIRIRFDYASDGMNPENESLTGFEVAGEDGIFIPASARIVNGSAQVEVWCDSVSQPHEVRYCFRNYQPGNLTNNVGIPAAGFRLSIP